MNLTTLETLGSIASAAAAVFTLLMYVRGEAKKRVAEDIRQRAQIAGERFAEGVASRNDEVRQLTYERDDARREREVLRDEKRELEREIRGLRNGRG